MFKLKLDARAIFFAAVALLFSLTAPAFAKKDRPPDQDTEIAGYVGHDVMIPMRDGVKLHAQIWRPKNASATLPILLQRSPYGFDPNKVKGLFALEFHELAEDGFIFVLQDIRGRFGSEGEFVMLRPKAGSEDGVDESTDAYDSIEWLINQIPDNNGKVGIFGISYLGWTTSMAAVNPHPALKAISVQASPEDMFIGDDFHHNGAFRLDYGWEYAAALETDGRTLEPFDFGDDDPYSWFLRQKSLETLDEQALGRQLPTWRAFVEHPNYDSYWRKSITSEVMPDDVKIPNLIVAGWWDQEDFYGPLEIYENQEKGDADNLNYLVIGPWNHGGWARGNGGSYGRIELGSHTAVYFRKEVETPWFRYWLKGLGALDQPEALVFETGGNQWRCYASWPPRSGVRSERLYLRQDGLLSFKPPSDEEAGSDQFLSDPFDPVPYRNRPIQSIFESESTWPVWLADDQAIFAKRPDVLQWRTPPLEEDITIRGDVIAQLVASTMGEDADWVVKLIDIYPDKDGVPAELRGYGQLIASEVFRGRFRESFEEPTPLEPNKPLAYTIDMHGASHVFKKGHRIAVQVQSTWFPLIDRNPQTFTPNIFEATAEEFKPQVHTVHHSSAFPSSILVSVAKERDAEGCVHESE